MSSYVSVCGSQSCTVLNKTTRIISCRCNPTFLGYLHRRQIICACYHANVHLIYSWQNARDNGGICVILSSCPSIFDTSIFCGLIISFPVWEIFLCARFLNFPSSFQESYFFQKHIKIQNQHFFVRIWSEQIRLSER